MAIEKSTGVTPTERYLADLCDRSFLKLWSYPNPFKDDGKELCDLIVVFENDVLIFFDRESHRLKGDGKNLALNWQRWRREVIDKQINTAHGAARYIKKGRPVFLDAGRQAPFPLPIRWKEARIHKIIVAHGAMEACRAHSPDNVSGSLAVSYSADAEPVVDDPFFLELRRDDPVHVFDSENLGIVLSELDTIFDFVTYLNAKHDAIHKYGVLTYCGEEDLVAHYLINFDAKSGKHCIGALGDFDLVHIGEGEWEGFKESALYKRRQAANQNSYAWDRLIQITAQNALSGNLIGNGDPFTGRSAIHFMAKEPRFVRRALSDKILASIQEFPESSAPIMRNVSLMPSFFKGTVYVFLQLKVTDRGDYDSDYRPKRTALLEIACGAAKLKWPELKRVVGIAIDAPKYSEMNSEDLLVMEFDEWDETKVRYYAEMNEHLRFFQTGKETRISIKEFPDPHRARERSVHAKVGRNDACPCGSGRKYKKCCL